MATNIKGGLVLKTLTEIQINEALEDCFSGFGFKGKIFTNMKKYVLFQETNVLL